MLQQIELVGLAIFFVGTGQQLDSMAGLPVRRSIRRFGDVLVTIKSPLLPGLYGGGTMPLPPEPEPERIPHTHGAVKPAGVADLLIVKQQLTGYEGADIAHIENVLRGRA